MSKKLEKLTTLLKELFQLDQPELDFGIYRIMHARSAEINAYLEKDLPAQVQEGFKGYKAADKSEMQAELDEKIAQARNLGVDPETVEAVQKLRKKIAEQAVDINGLEGDVYDHLYSFFRRYYSEGDFISKRVYKEGTYAIPYEGEEVKLYWANHDQYYIKTTEYLRDYAFRLQPDNEKKPMRVHFRLVDAIEGEHNNVKSADDKARVFVLASNPDSDGDDVWITEEKEDLVIRFEYRPATMQDWSETLLKDKKSPPKQKDLLEEAVNRILALQDSKLATWISELGKAYRKTDGTDADYPALQAHLSRYTARNTFDYFIHKDLGKFLHTELDFYLKNEVMHLDDIENESVLRVEQYLCRLKVIRIIAGKLIDFLAQLEDFQKKLWLKKKFVVETNYCITLDRIPESMYPDIVELGEVKSLCPDRERRSQREEWVKLFAIDEITEPVKYSVPLTVDFLKANDKLVLDTQFFNEVFKAKLLSTIENFDAQCDGLLIHSDNYQALNILHDRYREQVRCVYMDPPFNTGDDGFLYKDSYYHSSWLSMMDGRCSLIKETMCTDATLYAHIDYSEKERLKILLERFLYYITEIIWRIGWLSGYKTKAQKFIRNHDTIYQFGKCEKVFFKKTYIPYPEGYVRRDGNPPDGEGYPLEDTWNCYEIDSLNSIQIISFSKEKVGDKKLTQKNEALIERMLISSSEENNYVLDPFLGSGTTAAVAYKMKRKFIGIEQGEYFHTYVIPRLIKCLYGDKYGISDKYQFPSGGIIKYLRLESYEDTLNNLELHRTEEQQGLLDLAESKGTDKLKEQYLIRYMLDTESKDSASLLNTKAFTDPTAYKLYVKVPGSDESRVTNVDLLETFNYLIGLQVRHIAAPVWLTAGFERDSEKRLIIKAKSLKETPSTGKGIRWYLRTVTGTLLDGRRVLVIWRTRPGGDDPEGLEQDNLVLDEWFRKMGFSTKDSEFDLIYVNGSNNLENLKAKDDLWKVRLIEEDFKRLMFDTTGA